MQPNLVLLLFYSVLILLAVGWLATSSEWNGLLFLILFLASFSSVHTAVILSTSTVRHVTEGGPGAT